MGVNDTEHDFTRFEGTTMWNGDYPDYPEGGWCDAERRGFWCTLPAHPTAYGEDLVPHVAQGIYHQPVRVWLEQDDDMYIVTKEDTHDALE